MRWVIPAAVLASALGALLPASLLGALSVPWEGERAPTAPRVQASTGARPAQARAPRRNDQPARTEGAAVAVLIGAARAGPPVPADFLGLSFEAEALPQLAAYTPRGQLDQLLRSIGRGVVRFGGVSSDKSVAWVSPGEPQPSWASTAFSQDVLARVAALVRRVGWSALFTVNLGRYDPARAAREVAALRTSFARRLLGVEIGNEPNAYVNERLRSHGWSIVRWLRQLAAYRAQIARATGSVPLAIPDASSGVPQLRWVRAAAPLRPRLLTDHFYSLTSCNYMRPSIAQLLAPATRAAESAMLARLHSIVRASSTPMRLDETNDISCHGEPGVSNAFASALWAVDWIVRAMRAGVAGLNFHDLLDEPGAYSPLVLRGGRLHPNPEWYALLMTARLAAERPLAVAVRHGPANLATDAFLAPGRRPAALSVVLVNFAQAGSRPLAIRLRVPARFRSGTVLRLQAPAPAALGQVTLGGNEVGASGAWKPRLPLPQVSVAGGAFALQLPADSAALVTLSAG